MSTLELGRRSSPATNTLSLGKTLCYVLHDVHELKANPPPAATRVIISGHSHQPSIREENGVLYLNPGSAGRRRFRLPVSLATIEITEKGLVKARLLNLE